MSTVPVNTDPDAGIGWISFAAFMLGIVAILNVIYGIAAIADSKFYLASGTYVIKDLHLYGWIALLIGCTQFAAVFGLFSRATWARLVGILTASVSVIVQLLWIATYPFSALAI